MWIRCAVAGVMQLFAAQGLRAQQLSTGDFKTPSRYLADASLDVAIASKPWWVKGIGIVGKGYLFYSDVEDRRKRGASTPQALRDQAFSTTLQELSEVAPIGKFKNTTKSIAIAASKSGANSFVANRVDWFYTSLQSSIAPYSKLWRQRDGRVQGKVSGGTFADTQCSTKLPVGQEVYALAKELTPDGCQVQGSPEEKTAKSAQFSFSCPPRGGYQLSSRYALSKLNDNQIQVKAQYLIGGQWAEVNSVYERCDDAAQ